MKAFTTLLKSLIPSRKEKRQGNPIIPSLPKAPSKTPPKTPKTKSSSSTAPDRPRVFAKIKQGNTRLQYRKVSIFFANT